MFRLMRAKQDLPAGMPTPEVMGPLEACRCNTRTPCITPNASSTQQPQLKGIMTYNNLVVQVLYLLAGQGVQGMPLVKPADNAFKKTAFSLPDSPVIKIPLNILCTSSKYVKYSG